MPIAMVAMAALIQVAVSAASNGTPASLKIAGLTATM